MLSIFFSSRWKKILNTFSNRLSPEISTENFYHSSQVARESENSQRVNKSVNRVENEWLVKKKEKLWSNSPFKLFTDASEKFKPDEILGRPFASSTLRDTDDSPTKTWDPRSGKKINSLGKLVRDEQKLFWKYVFSEKCFAQSQHTGWPDDSRRSDRWTARVVFSRNERNIFIFLRFLSTISHYESSLIFTWLGNISQLEWENIFQCRSYRLTLCEFDCTSRIFPLSPISGE